MPLEEEAGSVEEGRCRPGTTEGNLRKDTRTTFEALGEGRHNKAQVMQSLIAWRMEMGIKQGSRVPEQGCNSSMLGLLYFPLLISIHQAEILWDAHLVLLDDT